MKAARHNLRFPDTCKVNKVCVEAVTVNQDRDRALEAQGHLRRCVFLWDEDGVLLNIERLVKLKPLHIVLASCSD
jgi:hypothetical protein